MLFWLLIFCCAKFGNINSSNVKEFFNNSNCAAKLEEKLKAVGCNQLKTAKTSEWDILFLCIKEDKHRKHYWDNNVFRISPTIMYYNDEDQIWVDKHTICLDNEIRIEAYSKDKISF